MPSPSGSAARVSRMLERAASVTVTSAGLAVSVISTVDVESAGMRPSVPVPLLGTAVAA